MFPGHERFVRNMLAGVGGIDLVLLVIAADESIKPQTREHFDILQLLGVQRGITVLTKSDAVDAETLDVVRLEVEEFLRGTFLDSAKIPIIAVSSLTGAGLDDLKRALTRCGGGSAAARFARPGPLANRSRVHHERIWHGGDRNAGGGDDSSRRRAGSFSHWPKGSRARSAGAWAFCRRCGCRATHRAEPGGRQHRGFIARHDAGAGCDVCGHAPAGCAAEPAALRAPPAEIPDASALPFQHDGDCCGDRAPCREATRSRIASALARLKLPGPALLLPGDRFIIRQFSPVVTIGGGVVLDPAPIPRMPGHESFLANSGCRRSGTDAESSHRETRSRRNPDVATCRRNWVDQELHRSATR